MAETGKIFKKEKDMKKGETEMQMWLNACGSYESDIEPIQNRWVQIYTPPEKSAGLV